MTAEPARGPAGDQTPEPAPARPSDDPEERFRALIERSGDLVAVIDANLLIRFANLAFESVLGLPVRDWLGRSIMDLLLPEDREATGRLLAESLGAPGVAVSWQARAVHADGAPRWLEGTGINELATPGINGLIVTCRDTTARARAEAALRESEGRLRQAARVADIGIFDHDHATGTIYWSARQREIHGWDPTAPVTLADFVELVHPDDRATVAATVQRAHDPAGDGMWDIEHRIVRRDGSLRWLRARSQTSFEGSGADRHPVRTVGAVIDDTERHLADADRRLRDQAIATSLNGIAIADADLRVIYVNPAFARMWGLGSEADAVGMTPMDFVDPEAARRVIDQLLEHGSWQGELVAQRADGTRFETTCAANVTRDESGRVSHVMASFADVTEANRLQAQFLHAQRLESIGRLAGGVAHDFNNLLTVMRGYLDLVLADMDPDGVPARDLGEVSRAVEMATDLTRQLLAFSRKQVTTPELVDLGTVVNRVARMLPRILGEDVQLRIVSTPDLWPICFDPGQCEQIVVNLAVNARDAMPDGGEITIETVNVHLDEQAVRGLGKDASPGDYVALSVTDTGIGMDVDVRDRLFEPFFTTKELGRGTGLGLAMAYGAVTQNHGWIDVASAPGAGSTFRIFLPRVEPSDVPAADTTTTEVRGGSESIIVVEDDDAVRRLATLILERAGYRVTAFADGMSAIEALDSMSEPADLLITDVVMPVLNGRQVADALTARQPSLRVAFASGYTADAIEQHGVTSGTVELIPKPYSAETLLRRTREILDQARA